MVDQQPTQVGDSGSTPTPSLHFEPCKLRDVAAFVRTYHYSHTFPGGIDFSFRLLMDGQLAGVALFGWMAGNPEAKVCGFGKGDVRELMRVVLLDEVPKNSETKFIGWCLRWLTRNTQIKAIVSFADPAHGHTGVIYKAGNWHYEGLQKPDRPRLIVDGIELHPRMAYDRYGTSSYLKIREMGHTVELRPREPKHCYSYLLHRSGK